MEKNHVLELKISTGSYQSFIDQIIGYAEDRQSQYVCVANVHMCIEAHRSREFAMMVNSAGLVTPDGQPLTWALRAIHGLDQERVAGMDMLPDLLEEAELRSLPVYFYGGTPDMLNKTRMFLEQKYPHLLIAGLESPPFTVPTTEEESATVARINASGAAVVLVVLGCPKQEKWMASMKGRIGAVMIGVGGALPVMIGLVKRAPRWMQRSGLEWTYRLGQEPKRLFRRYFVTNTTFLLLFFRELVKTRVMFQAGRGSDPHLT